MNIYRALLGIASSVSLSNTLILYSMHNHTAEQSFITLANNQVFGHIKREVYTSLQPHELRSLMSNNYFIEIIKNRITLTKIAEATITLARQQELLTFANEQEYTLLKTMYINHLIASRETQLSLKLRTVKNILSEHKQTLEGVYKKDPQSVYTILEHLAERVYTEVILPKTADKELLINQEFYTTYKQAYKNAFIAEKIKELKIICQ